MKHLESVVVGSVTKQWTHCARIGTKSRIKHCNSIHCICIGMKPEKKSPEECGSWPEMAELGPVRERGEEGEWVTLHTLHCEGFPGVQSSTA